MCALQLSSIQAGFGSDIARKVWTNKELGLKHTKATGKLNLLLDNTLRGFALANKDPISWSYLVCTVASH